jgi:hypothetical protein
MSLSRPHPHYPYTETGVKLGDEQFARDWNWAERKIFALVGMLQIGPLEKFLYKPSVSVRGYYWRAGLEMFKDYP